MAKAVKKWIVRSKNEPKDEHGRHRWLDVASEREAIAESPTRSGEYGPIIGGKYIKASPKRIYSLEYRDRRNATRRATYKQLTSV